MRKPSFKTLIITTLCICTTIFSIPSQLFSREGDTPPIHVIHSCDANIDSIMATTVLLADPQISLQGVVVTNADCFPEYAMSIYEKMPELLNCQFPCGLSKSRVWNQFPWIWKGESIKLDQSPCLKCCNEKEKQLLFNGDSMLVKMLQEGDDNSIVIMATGPLSTIADALKANNALEKKIKAMYWMGGADVLDGRCH